VARRVCDLENVVNEEGHSPRWAAAPHNKKLEYRTNQLHACYNLIAHYLHVIALKVRNQEVSCKDTGIMVQCMSTYVVYGKSYVVTKR
jgi:hypothetical protein